MEKKEYLVLVKTINKALRKKGVKWHKTYSEPRKTGTGFRTKLFYIEGKSSGMQDVVNYINENFGTKVVAEVLQHRNGPRMYWSDNVVYKPKMNIK